ncbi:protein-tyrosine-phosphatase [Flavobacterium quisquiliarum]|uniref:arsenate-mycothiol transferase ArsC n=1 Tax=Flavobacterium quisquiliarum TaxID=1834436 RepID=UPI001C5620BE|nr:protein-tyrosine-phosphatase [Flavobacterium quisquiliarum]MBW1653985.1 protein-tyrosine-phosphatase [Flavobacterium quisquiliarum]MBW1655993.1 protein-tyrosine-phosphatase [Flavobacterium quisquiliarum]MBW1656168.1 protein-tyrosine-phosphatase [Flavobacterium quisquiliarum]MBW1658665.1 protein-tyrosine-phosphatase [Flavobacterium quisquiliarum]
MLYPQIENTVKSFDFKQISEERKAVLQPLIDFIQTKADGKLETRLNLICTHNSRRSHLSQVWAQTAAAYYGIENVSCYSGGTEATALFPMAAEILKHSGFNIKTLSEGSNPVYSIKYSPDGLPVIGFSKTYDDDFNPESGFAAIMTCSQAAGGCPFIAGAEKRIPITFEDPKISDGTPQQKETYLERSLQIGTEMFYIFSQIKK